MPMRSGAMRRPAPSRWGITLRHRYEEVGLPWRKMMGSPSPTSTYAIRSPSTSAKARGYRGSAPELIAVLLTRSSWVSASMAAANGHRIMRTRSPRAENLVVAVGIDRGRGRGILGAAMVTKGPGALLVGRRSECEVLDRLLAAVRGGRSGVLVLRGEPGVGKTALLEYAIESARRFRVARAVGVESEMELPFAALQQLCAPMLDRLEGLPSPQRDALGVAFGLSAVEAPSRFLVGLAVLSLVSE